MSIVLQSSKQFKYTENSFLVFRIRLLLFSSLTRRNNRKRKDVKHIDNHLSFLSYFNVNNLLETKFLSKKKKKHIYTRNKRSIFLFVSNVCCFFFVSFNTHRNIHCLYERYYKKRNTKY